jgi:hypothetical protein
LAEPAFKLYDTVEYRWSVGGPFIGEARVIEVFADGCYRLERLNSTPFPKDGSIFGEEHLQAKAAHAGRISLGRWWPSRPPNSSSENLLRYVRDFDEPVRSVAFPLSVHPSGMHV